MGNRLDGDVSGWSPNTAAKAATSDLAANPRVRVKLGRRWYAGTATIVDSDDAQARRRRIDEGNGLAGRIDGVIFRASASTPITVGIDLDHASDENMHGSDMKGYR